MWKAQHAKFWKASALILTLSACSEIPAASETSAAIFRALEQTLPTASRSDTPQTRREIGIHRKVFFELCDDFGDCREPAP